MDGRERATWLRERIANGEYPNMLIDEQYRQCVCFLGVKEQNNVGAMAWKPRATGFFIAMPLNDTAWVHYLVTARHVIDQSRRDGMLYAQINLTSGGVRLVEVPQDAWFLHPSTDVAIIGFQFESDFRMTAVKTDLIGQAAENYNPDSAYTRVDVGDQLFVIGLFAQYAGDEQAEPIVRFGQISLGRKQIPLRLGPQTTPKKVDAYLAETKSWGGESGSPVFHSKWPSSPMVQISTTMPRLIGLLHGHYDITKATRSRAENIDLNSGIGVVIPSSAIWEVLMDQELVAEREKKLAEMKRNVHVPTPDSAKTQ